jgi:para-aminobenzoate synthetase component 1
MKGTADASVPSAKRKLLEDEKEIYEHNTVVDLLRNDISYASINVEVKRYRYIDEIETGKGRLLQVSSEISGDLDSRWYDNPAGTLLKMLPAGSVSGAQKKRTLQIIKEVEGTARGFYTGIFGVFDGEKLATSVNIRYIERRNGRFFYRSGGGITAFSNPEKEYAEYIKKIYLPVV